MASSFIMGPGGRATLPTELTDDVNTGISPWLPSAVAGIETSFTGTTSLGLASQESFVLPSLAREPIEDTIEKETSFWDPGAARGRVALPPTTWRYFSEQETTDRGDILITNQDLFKKQFPRVPYELGMTAKRAIAIEEQLQKQDSRDYLMKDRPITSFFSQLAGNIPAPENFVPFLPEAMWLGKTLRIGKTLAFGAKGATEAAVGSAVFDIATWQTREKLGQDVSWAAMGQDIAFSALIGLGFGTGASFFHTPGKAVSEPRDLANTNENQARANVILNDAIGSFLNSPDYTVKLSPQSYTYIQDTTASVTPDSFSYNWNHVQVEDAPKVQEFAEQNLLNDPAIASLLEGTQVADTGGKPIVVYTGSMVPEQRRFRPDLDSLNVGIGPMDNYGSSLWFSTNAKHAKYFVDYLGTHPDIQNIDYPIDITKWKGREQGTRAVKINDEYFIGGVHAEALDKAVSYYGPDSQVIRDFENLPEDKQIEAMGHLDKDGFTPGATAIMDKEEILGYIREQREFLNRQAELTAQRTETGEIEYGIVPPRIEGALVDIKKPMEISAKDFADNKARMDRVFEARDAKDKDGNPLYDGVVAKGIEINGEKGDVYATWLPDSVLTMRDASATHLRNEQARKIANYQDASKLAETNGYTYSQPQYREYANIQGADFIPAVNIDALAKEVDILKYSEDVVKAAGGDLKSNITPQDEKFKAFQANRELTQETLRAIEEADTFIKKASFIEQVMQLAVGCKDG